MLSLWVVSKEESQKQHEHWDRPDRLVEYLSKREPFGYQDKGVTKTLTLPVLSTVKQKITLTVTMHNKVFAT